ncbi:hypothetical protein ACHHYP_15855 [Achlya hypogyna]|uniref:Uncharacterized protein n=1 Tax=Achlya hypogyna TaxID=1202772 RepID=A0A1V9YA06_ACHHY|nr:hypothetical protein ACHHYP_15855 [Achlya hypogyna]
MASYLPALPDMLHLPVLAPLAEPSTTRRMDIRELITPMETPRYLVMKKAPKQTKEKDTRSKARPGFRKGKWTDEESVYAERMTHYFKEGLLPLEKGTMLRMYLAEKLNCEPMRITKKFTGDECIGKQIFRPLPPTPLVTARMQSVQTELKALETAFLQRIEEMPMYCMSTKEKATTPDAKIIKRGKLRLRKPVVKPKELKAKGPAEDAQAATLLLGFFHGADNGAVSPVAQNPFLPVVQDAISPSIKDDPPAAPYRSRRKFSVSHCAEELEYELYEKRPRLDAMSLCP